MVELIRPPRRTKRIHFVPAQVSAHVLAQGHSGMQELGPAIDVARLVEGRLLSAEEEAACFRRMNALKERASRLETVGLFADSSEAPLLAEALAIRNGLARVFLGLSMGLARRFVNDRFPFDELASEANLTLLQAIENFDAALGFRFSTYATRAVRRNLYRHIIRQRQRSRQEAAVECLVETPDYRQTYERDLDAPTPAEVRSIVGELRDRDAYIVRRRFGLFPEGDQFTLQRVADELGVTRERVRQLENRALRQLRELATERFAGMIEA